MQFVLGHRHYPGFRLIIEAESLDDVYLRLHGLVDKWVEGETERGEKISILCKDVDRIWPRTSTTSAGYP